MSQLIQFPTDRKVPFLWKPRKRIKATWRIGARNKVLAFSTDRVAPAMQNYDTLLNLMADDYLFGGEQTFSEVYDRFFPYGPANGKISRFQHQSNLYEEVETRINNKLAGEK